MDKVKIVNVSDQPYEWTHDGKVYGPLEPGHIGEYERQIADQAVRKSYELDEIGNPTFNKVEYLDSLREDRARFSQIVAIPCPFTESGECSEGPFQTREDLKAHLETHWASMEEPVAASGRAGSSRSPSRR